MIDVSNFDPYAVAESISAQALRLSEFTAGIQTGNESTAEIIRNVATTAQNALESGRLALESGETEAALFAIGCAEGAMHIIRAVLSAPNHPVVAEMTKPFIGGRSNV